MRFLRSNERSALSDRELVVRYRYSYDNQYIGELFQRYSHLVFGVCLNHLGSEERAKDAVMEVFEKVLLELRKHDVEYFKTWLYSVARNHCLMGIRKDTAVAPHREQYEREGRRIVETDLELHLNGENAEETDKRLEAAIGRLKVEQRTCIRMFYFDKKTYEQIAQETGYTVKEVKSYLQNGKRNLGNWMRKNG
jgi:RNA polymerase sigma factor (sigma-70 family)